MTEEEQKTAVSELITKLVPVERVEFVPAAIHETLQAVWAYQAQKPKSWHHAKPKAAVRQLVALANALREFRQAAELVSRDTYELLWEWRGDQGLEWEAFSAPVQALRLLDEQYPDLERGTREVAEWLDQWRRDAGKLKDSGRPSNPDVRKLADDLVRIYLVATGLTPTRRTRITRGSKAYGPYYDFVAGVFRIAGVTASVEHCSRMAKESLMRAME
jgi:hypothetical protein